MPIRVLVADDHAVFRQGLTALLAREPDMEVVGEAAEGNEVIRAAERPEVDVLLLDISMPGLSGVAVADAVRKKRPDLAIVVLTMHEDEEYLRACLRIGVRGFVLKKSASTDVIQAIRAAHRGEQYIDPSLANVLVAAYLGNREKNSAFPGLLSAREKDVCRLLAYGHTNAEIADDLGVSPRTVESHRSSLMTKLALRTRAELVRFAIDHGLMKPGASEAGPQQSV